MYIYIPFHIIFMFLFLQSFHTLCPILLQPSILIWIHTHHFHPHYSNRTSVVKVIMTLAFDKSNDLFIFFPYLANQHWLTQSKITSSLKHILHLVSSSQHSINFAPTHLMFLNLLILPNLPDTLKLSKGSVLISPLNLN